MAVLTVQDVSRAGVNSVGVAAAGGGDQFANDGRTVAKVRNGGGSPINVTLVTAAAADPEGLAITDKVVAVPAGEERTIGPFPTGVYNDPTGYMNLSYSGVTSVTVAALRVTPE